MYLLFILTSALLCIGMIGLVTYLVTIVHYSRKLREAVSWSEEKQLGLLESGYRNQYQNLLTEVVRKCYRPWYTARARPRWPTTHRLWTTLQAWARFRERVARVWRQFAFTVVEIDENHKKMYFENFFGILAALIEHPVNRQYAVPITAALFTRLPGEKDTPADVLSCFLSEKRSMVHRWIKGNSELAAQFRTVYQYFKEHREEFVDGEPFCNELQCVLDGYENAFINLN